MYLFPGYDKLSPLLHKNFFYFTDGSLVIFRIGLGALLSGARHISDDMLQAGAEWYVMLDETIYGCPT